MSCARKTLFALLLCLVLPAAAGAQERTIAPTSAGPGPLVYRVEIEDGSAIRGGWLEGRARTYPLSTTRLRQDLRGRSVHVVLPRRVRRQLGGRPRLVLRLADPLAQTGAAAAGASEAVTAERPPAEIKIGVSPAVPVAVEPIPTSCSRYASPDGSDSANGSREAPFESAQRLVNALGPGDVGCLDAGTYHSSILAIRQGGTAERRLVLRSTPGQRALITGQIWIADSANYVTVANVDHDATYESAEPRPSPVVNGDYALFYGMNVWSRNGVCFYLGDREWGVATGTIIRNDRIHDCGQPGLNKRHAIYMAQAVDTVIEENEIYDNPDRGIQLYPNSQGAIIRHNVLDGNGEGIIFSGVNGDASSGNLVEDNLITNSHLRYNVESWWPEGNPVGEENIVRGNCVSGGNFGEIQEPQVGFTAYDNFFVAPLYVDRADKDFRLRDDSPCQDVLYG